MSLLRIIIEIATPTEPPKIRSWATIAWATAMGTQLISDITGDGARGLP